MKVAAGDQDLASNFMSDYSLFISVTAHRCSDDTLLAAVLIFFKCFGSHMTTGTAKFVFSADLRQ